jgi:pimeloyl-ACP methyl ester carboxylesterase
MQALSTASKFLWPIPDRGLRRRIHRLQSPTLIVWGESDRLVSPSYAEDFRSQIKDARVTILPECGHQPMLEKQDEFVSLVAEFLEER